jgi:hypothetical protein
LPQAIRYLKELAPQAQVMHEDGRVTQAYGTALAFGASPAAAAERFRLDHADVFGVTPDELMPEGFDGTPANELDLMFAPDTGTFKFKLFRYQQVRDGVPVFRGELRVLVRNELDFPVVLATGNVRPLDDYVVPFAANPQIDPTLSADPALDTFSPPDLVIFAGIEGRQPDKTKDNAPRLAYSFIAEVGDPLADGYEKWLYVVDAANGKVLYDENQVLLEDISGNVSALATTIPKESSCSPELSTPMAHAEVSISGGSTAYADANGDFTIPNGGTSSVTVNSPMAGLYFFVNDVFASLNDLAQSATPPGPADFVHNQANTDEYVRAQINGYVQANVVRDFALNYSPSYPVISTQTNFPVVVNRADVYCPGNAWYDGGAINFCRTGSGYPNTSFASVIHHEYGHHLVASGGSGQDQYGEGMSDCISLLIADDPILGYGFLGDCNAGIRSADNTFQYPCSGEGHTCGQLISGCIWSTRNELAATYPGTYLDILSNLTVNSIPLHTGSTITPAITNHFLTLDDDDADLGNGTPHSPEILAGFGVHNMVPGPPPANDAIAGAMTACPGNNYAGNTASATVDGASSCATSSGSPDVWYKYTPDNNGTLTASLCTGTTYDAALSIHSGSPANTGNELACDDDFCASAGPAQASASVTAGNTYYIRVTGWSGSAGSYNLTVTGPPCAPDAPLAISYPNGLPSVAAPVGGATFDVQIDDGTETYQSGTAMLHYRYDAGAYQTAALAALGGNQYEATLPGGACGEVAEFYVSAESTLASTVTSPSTAPASVFNADVGVVSTVLADDFETDTGWTTANLGASSGDWQRGVPVNDPGWDYDPSSDSDGSGQCYLTQNQAGNTDIDGGEVQLISPMLDLTAGNITISYDYFLRLTNTDGSDWIKVAISSNGDAGPWTNLVTHSTDGGLSWRHHELDQTDLDNAGVTLTSNMKLRFRAIDAGAASINESGIDAFSVTSFSCSAPDPCEGDADGDGDVDITDLGIVLSQFGTSGGGLQGDVDGDLDVDITDLGIVLAAFGSSCP